MRQRCNRCRNAEALPNDTYCLAGAAWEGIGRELQSSWSSAGCRAIGAELVVAVARNLRALRNVATTIPDRAGREPEPQQLREADKEEDRDQPCSERDPSPGQRAAGATPKVQPKEKAPSTAKPDSLDEDAEEEEEVPTETVAPLGGGDRRKPPEPDEPSPGREGKDSKRPKLQSVHRGEDRGSEREVIVIIETEGTGARGSIELDESTKGLAEQQIPLC